MSGMIKILVLLPVLLFGQYQQGVPFTSVRGDTITNFTSQDTVQYRLWVNGVASDYYTLSTYVAASDKTAENTIEIILADDDNWTWAEYVDFKIYNDAVSITSNTFAIGGLRGAVTLFVKPDTMGTITRYRNTVIGGN